MAIFEPDGPQLHLGASCCLGVKEGLLSGARDGDLGVIKGHLQCPNANINILDDRGRSLLMVASIYGHLHIIEINQLTINTLYKQVYVRNNDFI